MPYPDPADDEVRLLCWKVRPSPGTSTIALLDCFDDVLRHCIVAASWREAAAINEALLESGGEPVPVTAETFAILARGHDVEVEHVTSDEMPGPGYDAQTRPLS